VSKQYAPTTATAKLTADHLNHTDEVLMQAFATAGALVALANGQPESVERRELVNFIHRQGFVRCVTGSIRARCGARSVESVPSDSAGTGAGRPGLTAVR
jgi:tellurite resistance protein